MHEELCQVPLRSGKMVFVDKTFAPAKEIAQRLFDLAQEYHTPVYSCSALRFADALQVLHREDIQFINSRGPGSFDTYLIHQVEPIVSILGVDVQKLMVFGTKENPGLILDYGEGRGAVLNHFGWDCPFSFTLGTNGQKTVVINQITGYFDRFFEHMLCFFQTGKGDVPSTETIAIMAILEKERLAEKVSGSWVAL